MTADLDGMPFAIVRRGYDRAQVEDRLTKLLTERDNAHTNGQNAVAERERISRELDTSRGETRAARSELAETRHEVERLAAQVAELSTIPHTVDGMSDRLQQMVRVAQDEVNDMRARGTRGAAQILSMAQAEADELRDSAHQERRIFEAEQRTAQEELRARLEETRAQLAALREEADGQRARLDAELAERRARDEQTLAAELADRREMMLADLAGQEKRQREEAQRIVDAASARARAMVADAVGEADRERSQTREQVVRSSEELEQLRTLQHQVAEQLAGVRSLLDWTLPRINPAPGAISGEVASPTVALPTAAAGLETSPAPRSGSSRLDVPGSVTHDEQGDEVRAFDEPTSSFDPIGRDAPLFGETVTTVDDADGRERGSLDLDDDERGVGERSLADPQAVRGGADMESSVRGTGIPRQRGGEQAETSRPSPVARSGQRASARR